MTYIHTSEGGTGGRSTRRQSFRPSTSSNHLLPTLRLGHACGWEATGGNTHGPGQHGPGQQWWQARGGRVTAGCTVRSAPLLLQHALCFHTKGQADRCITATSNNTTSRRPLGR